MAIINTSIQNIKDFLAKEGNTLPSFFLFLSLTFIAFTAGMLYERNLLRRSFPTEITLDQEIYQAWQEFKEIDQIEAQFFASRNGTKYYPIGCSAGNRIQEENKVYFQTEIEAQEAGYSVSSRC